MSPRCPRVIWIRPGTRRAFSARMTASTASGCQLSPRWIVGRNRTKEQVLARRRVQLEEHLASRTGRWEGSAGLSRFSSSRPRKIAVALGAQFDSSLRNPQGCRQGQQNDGPPNVHSCFISFWARRTRPNWRSCGPATTLSPARKGFDVCD